MPPCVVERPGAKRGGSDRAVCNVSEARVSVVKRPVERRGREGGEPVRRRRRPWKGPGIQKRGLRNPPADLAVNVRMVGLGTRESRLRPAPVGGGERCPPI